MNNTYLNAIKSFEGFTRTAKWDYAQHSNGYGTKARYAGEVIDEAEAERRFADELKQARSLVDAHAGHLDEGTKAALTSLTYNAGTGWIKSGLGQAVASGDLEHARQLFLLYNKAGGQVLAGLTQRRAVEASWIGRGNNEVERETFVPRGDFAHAIVSDPPTQASATPADVPYDGSSAGVPQTLGGSHFAALADRLGSEPFRRPDEPAFAPLGETIRWAHLRWLLQNRSA